MSHRVDHYRERMVEHLQAREWTPEDIEHFAHMVGHSALLSSESALFVLEFQQATDERIQAEKDFDATFVPAEGWGNGLGSPETALNGWDDMGNYHNPGVPIIEATPASQQHFQDRFEGIQ